MAYLNCPSCGLSFRVQALDLVVEKCPRCLARAGRVTKLLLSDTPQVFGSQPPGTPHEDMPPAGATGGEPAPEPAF